MPADPNVSSVTLPRKVVEIPVMITVDMVVVMTNLLLLLKLPTGTLMLPQAGVVLNLLLLLHPVVIGELLLLLPLPLLPLVDGVLLNPLLPLLLLPPVDGVLLLLHLLPLPLPLLLLVDGVLLLLVLLLLKLKLPLLVDGVLPLLNPLLPHLLPKLKLLPLKPPVDGVLPLLVLLLPPLVVGELLPLNPPLP